MDNEPESREKSGLDDKCQTTLAIVCGRDLAISTNLPGQDISMPVKIKAS